MSRGCDCIVVRIVGGPTGEMRIIQFRLSLATLPSLPPLYGYGLNEA